MCAGCPGPVQKGNPFLWEPGAGAARSGGGGCRGTPRKVWPSHDHGDPQSGSDAKSRYWVKSGSIGGEL